MLLLCTLLYGEWKYETLYLNIRWIYIHNCIGPNYRRVRDWLFAFNIPQAAQHKGPRLYMQSTFNKTPRFYLHSPCSVPLTVLLALPHADKASGISTKDDVFYWQTPTHRRPVRNRSGAAIGWLCVLGFVTKWSYWWTWNVYGCTMVWLKNKYLKNILWELRVSIGLYGEFCTIADLSIRSSGSSRC